MLTTAHTSQARDEPSTFSASLITPKPEAVSSRARRSV